MSDFINRKIVRAQKPHTCQQCGKEISKGVEYSRAAGNVDGVFFTSEIHLDCLAAYQGILSAFEYLQDGMPDFQWHDWQQNEKAWLARNFPSVHSKIFGAMPATNIVPFMDKRGEA